MLNEEPDVMNIISCTAKSYLTKKKVDMISEFQLSLYFPPLFPSYTHANMRDPNGYGLWITNLS